MKYKFICFSLRPRSLPGTEKFLQCCCGWGLLCKTEVFNQPTDPKHNSRELVSPEHLQIHHTKGEPDKEAKPRHPDPSKPFCSPHALLVYIPEREANAAVAKRWRGTTKPAAVGMPGLLRSLCKRKPKPFLHFWGPLTSSLPTSWDFSLQLKSHFKAANFPCIPPWPKLPNSKATFTRGRGTLACYLNSCFRIKPNLYCTIPEEPETSQCHPRVTNTSFP